jgi:integrase/recombinase XerC
VHTVAAYDKDLMQFADYLHRIYDKDSPETATHTEIRSWMVSMMEQGATARTVNRKISVLKSFYKFLMRQGLLTKSPMQKVTAPKTAKRLPVFVEQKSIDLLLTQVAFDDTMEGLRDKIMLEILYGTGMRRSELHGLQETDIDSYNAQIKVLGKGNKERIIPIQPQLCEAMRQYITFKRASTDVPTPYLLVHTTGERLTVDHIYRIVKKYLGAVTTLDKKSPHVLRHTFATHLMNNGADINAVKELLGHASLAATQVYTHNTIEKLKSIHKQAHPRA